MTDEKWDGITERRLSHSITKSDALFLADALADKSYKVFGFKVQELVVVLGILLAVFAFYTRTNSTLQLLTILAKDTETFKRGSDSFHSTYIGTSFEGGRPVNSGFNQKRREPNE